MKKIILSVFIFASAVMLSSCCGSGCGYSNYEYPSYNSSCCGGGMSNCCGAGGW